MYKNKCELIEKNLCLGCTRSLAEKDWEGAEKCVFYKKYKQQQEIKNEDIWNIRK